LEKQKTGERNKGRKKIEKNKDKKKQLKGAKGKN